MYSSGQIHSCSIPSVKIKIHVSLWNVVITNGSKIFKEQGALKGRALALPVFLLAAAFREPDQHGEGGEFCE